MYVNNDSGNTFTDLSFQPFASYAKNLVQYYNKGGFTDAGGTFHVSAACPNETITWWGIYNEPSINNNLTATEREHVQRCRPGHAVWSIRHLSLLRWSFCCSSESWVQTFAAGLNANAIDTVATHYYSSCNQKDTDAELLATVPGFASSVQTIYANLATNPTLANVPVWITENNVNADFNKGNGISAQWDGLRHRQTRDKCLLRGVASVCFFAGWKGGSSCALPLGFRRRCAVRRSRFIQLVRRQLSYWVDYWIGQMFPSGTGQQSLQFTNSDDPDIEVLPVLNTDGSVVIIISNTSLLRRRTITERG